MEMFHQSVEQQDPTTKIATCFLPLRLKIRAISPIPYSDANLAAQRAQYGTERVRKGRGNYGSYPDTEQA